MAWVNQQVTGSYAARSHDPVLFAEQVAMAGWLRAGEPVALMAARLRRPIPQVRFMLFGEV